LASSTVAGDSKYYLAGTSSNLMVTEWLYDFVPTGQRWSFCPRVPTQSSDRQLSRYHLGFQRPRW